MAPSFYRRTLTMALAHTLDIPRIGADRGPVQHAQELTKWFDTHHHDLVPEFTAGQTFALSWEHLFDEVDEAHALGHRVKPVIIGPLTYLWRGKAKGGDFDKLDLLERLLPVYGEIFNRLKAQGVEWVQIDEPILTLDLPLAWRSAFERAYHILQYSPLKKLLATCFSGLQDNLGLAAGLPVDGLHVDAVHAPEQLGQVLDRLPTYKILSVGLVNGRNAWRCELEQALAQLRPARERFGENLWVSTLATERQGFRQPLGNLHQTVTQLWQRA
jgi:5-methyltetrahydropteroyltriglutamate--homocysteine methyltransferase